MRVEDPLQQLLMANEVVRLPPTVWDYGFFLWYLFCFLIGIVTAMQINVTSVLTHNASGTTTACVNCSSHRQNPTNIANLFGLALVLIGTMLYASVQRKDTDAAAEASKRAAAVASGGSASASSSAALSKVLNGGDAGNNSNTAGSSNLSIEE